MAIASVSECGRLAGFFALERWILNALPGGQQIFLSRGRAILLVVNAHVARFDHIQIAAPEGCESAARHFYGTILGLKEIEKPPILRVRGGCWFECGSQQLHVGVERNFQPARKAHPALSVFHLDDLREALQAQGVAVVDDDNLPGARRFYADDPWGNRLEFVELAR